ncbi:hypothetical protein Taro_015859 [Colocasia esculenta]|uniref:Uncharacterized protein n=1 Tax=Colocasia esculenta TaxID=4460 RepID=A0A843UIQ2_COLES|nr:hypothetical protein [Colocasia esculenta]
MVATVGAKEGGSVDVGVEVVEQVEGLEQAGVEAWDCGLCQGHLPAAVVTAAVAVAVVDTVAGRAGTVAAAVAVVIVAAVVAAVTSVVAAVVSDPAGLSMVLTLRRLLPIVVPWLLRLLSVWEPTYWALGVADSTYLFIGLDPFNDWAFGFLDITGFGGLKHGVYRRVFKLGLNEAGSAIQLVHGSNVIHGQDGSVGWGSIGDQQLDFLLFRHGAADFRSQ